MHLHARCAACYGTPFDFIAFFDIIDIKYCLKSCIFTKKFIDYMANQYTYFDKSTYKEWRFLLETKFYV